MNRWSVLESKKLSQMRETLGKSLTGRKQMPDVVGDRRLLRFLRGHDGDVAKGCQMYLNFLHFRDQHNVDDIRNDILFNPTIKTPLDFPNGRKILNLVPQIIIAHNALDNIGSPLVTESFGFDAELVIKSITKDEYTLFMIYALEYKILVLEQLSHEREVGLKAEIEQHRNTLANNHIKSHSSAVIETVATYGTIVMCLIIRDFDHFGFNSLNSSSKMVIKWILEIAVENYPEMQHKCHMIRIPWFFNTIWFFLKNLLDANILSKLTLSNSNDYLKKLQVDMPLESIPVSLGGTYEHNVHEPFVFDLSPTGPFYYPECPFMLQRAVALNQQKFTTQQKDSGGLVKAGKSRSKKGVTIVIPTSGSFSDEGENVRNGAAVAIVNMTETTEKRTSVAGTGSRLSKADSVADSYHTDLENTQQLDKKKTKRFSKKRVLQFFGLSSKRSDSNSGGNPENGKSDSLLRCRSSSFDDLHCQSSNGALLVNSNSIVQGNNNSSNSKHIVVNMHGDYEVVGGSSVGAGAVNISGGNAGGSGGSGGNVSSNKKVIQRMKSLPEINEFVRMPTPLEPRTPRSTAAHHSPTAAASVYAPTPRHSSQNNRGHYFPSSTTDDREVVIPPGDSGGIVGTDSHLQRSLPTSPEEEELMNPYVGESVAQWQTRRSEYEAQVLEQVRLRENAAATAAQDSYRASYAGYDDHQPGARPQQRADCNNKEWSCWVWPTAFSLW